MRDKLTAFGIAASLYVATAVGGGQALGLGGPGEGNWDPHFCVAMCSAQQYERDAAILEELYARWEECGDDQSCRDAAEAWADEQLAESRKMWEACNKSCEPGW